MSTRANIVVKDEYDTLWFYQHGDGYPEGVLPTLFKFMNWVKSGRIRDNAIQSSGWLILLGVESLIVDMTRYRPEKTRRRNPFEPCNDSLYGWKAGSIEPTVGQHGDIDYKYIVDLEEKTVMVYEPGWEGEPDKLIGKMNSKGNMTKIKVRSAEPKTSRVRRLRVS